MNEVSEKKRKSRNIYEDIHQYKEVKQLNNLAYGVWKKQVERCVICGNKHQTTTEHIPPKSVFSQLPVDVVTVRACNKCQKSPDREFADFLAPYCCQTGETESSRSLLVYRKKIFKEKGMSSNYKEYVLQNSNLKKIYITNKNRIITPALLSEWPSSFHDPVILKMIHGYYWLLTKGKILSDESGKLIIIRDYNPTTEVGGYLTGSAFPSVNIGKGQFICTHIQGFEKPYNVITSMGFHFHTNNNARFGYHVLAILCIDKLFKIEGQTDKLNEIIDLAPKDSIYNLKDPVYSHYPY